MPLPGSGAGYRPSEFVMPLLLMPNGGGQALEDLRQVRNDTAPRDLPGPDRIPSSDAVGNRLRRAGMSGGLYGLDQINREVLARSLRSDSYESCTLDIDAAAIEAARKPAKMSYKGFRGYMPLAGHLAENGLVAFDEFREGNNSPGARNLDFIKACCARMPCGQFWANAVFFRLGILAYNLFRLFELKVLPDPKSADWALLAGAVRLTGNIGRQIQQ